MSGVLVVFDVGGTTLRDNVGVSALVAATLEHYGIAAGPDQIREYRGASKREVIERLVGAGSRADLDPAEVYGRFQRSLIDAFVTQGAEAVPGVEAAIRALREDDIRGVLATGFDTHIMAVVLDQLGWGEMVDAVVTADGVTRGRPAPDLVFAAMRKVRAESPTSAAVVGDTVNDLRAAEAAGVGARLGVLTGAHDRQQLAQAAPTAIPDTAASVPLLARGPSGCLGSRRTVRDEITGKFASVEFHDGEFLEVHLHD